MPSIFVGPWNEPLERSDEDRTGERVARVGAEVQLHVHADAEQHAVVGDRGLDVGALLACLAADGEVLEAVLDPLHRPAEVDRGRDHRDLVALHAVLQAEPAADVVGEHADVLHRDVDLRRQKQPQHVRRLRRRVDREVLGRLGRTTR